MRGSVVECGSLRRFGSLRKAAKTAALQDAPAPFPSRLAKRVLFDSFSLREKGGRRPDEGEKHRIVFCEGRCLATG